MKPLLATVVAACLLLATNAFPENIEDVKELSQSKGPELEAEETDPQTRAERCTTCSGNVKLNLNSPNQLLAQLQTIPGAEVHTQQSFEGCSSDKGCAGIKVKDGSVIERFGNLDAFRAAAAADTGNEFTFHAAGNLGNVFEGGIPGNGPFWWMNENSPFKAGANGGSYVSKSSSSSYSTSGNAGALNGAGISGANAGAGGAAFGGGIDLSGNPFLNGEFSKLGGGFTAGQDSKPANSFQSSSFESSSFSSSNKGEVDLSKNPFLNGGLNKFSGSGFQAQGGYAGSSQGGAALNGQGSFNGAQNFGNSQSSFSSGRNTGYTGSSPSPFTASTAGNVNLIQNTQKSEFEFDQQQQTQQNIDDIFQSTGNVHAHEHSGGELQQTCAGQGYACVHKAQCNNGVVNTNGAGVLQAQTKKQYCNVKTEICCRIEITALAGAGGLQGSLGVGSATYSGSATQGSGIFATSNQGAQNTANSGSASFGANRGSFGSNQGSFGSTTSNFGSSTFEQTNRGAVNQGTQGTGFGATGSFGSGSNYGSSTFGGSVNRGVTVGSTNYDASQGTTFSSSANKFGATGSFGNNFGSTVAPITPTRFASNGNEVYKQTSQSNFIETDSFSAGSENAGVFRPGASGSGLKPGIPYLPPVDSSNSGSSVISSTAFPSTFYTTPRPVTPLRPTYLPPVSSTAAPGYLPPEVPEQTINTETRVPNPNYNEGQLILDETRPRPRPAFVPSEVPAGCAAALKCTPIEFCTAEGVISNTTVILTKDQDAYRVPLTDCKDIESGRIGKCCRDPLYTDPWPTNQLGKWVPGVFGGNDGKYVPDSRGSGSINRPQVTVRPPVTGSTLLNNLGTPKPTVTPFGPNQITPGFPGSSVTQSSFGQKGQYDIRGQGQIGQGGQGQYTIGGQGQQSLGGQVSQGSQFATSSTQGSFSQGSTILDATRGQGVAVSQGQGQYSQGGRGQIGIVGQGQFEVQGQGAQGQFTQTTQNRQSVIQSQTGSQGQGQAVITGQGVGVSQGFGTGIRQGQGFSVSQGGGFNVENEYTESASRVFLQAYNAGGQCGQFNGQKPFGNRNELEVDFAEIPWQAMVLLQTNRSLLCGGVITRPDVVITSAACVDGLEARNVLIKGGEWKLGIDDEPLPFQIVQVKTIVRHPFYKRGSLLYDAAILVLSENLRFAKNIYPICLPRAGETLDAYYNGAGECIVTGWGKQVLQAHLSGAIMHSINVSLINPGECQAKLSQDYPHLLEQYDQESCACGQPTNPINNICRVDIGSALACTTGDSHFVLRGIYSWDSGCQPGNQLAAFYKFDLEWYEWAIGLIESARFAQYTSGSQILSQNRFAGQINSGVKGGSGQFTKGGINGFGQGQSQFSSSQNQFTSGQFGTAQTGGSGLNFNAQLKGPVSNTFSATYSEKKVFQSEPKIITYTTKPEIVTFTTKPEYFTYTTKPKIVTYTTKPQIITYETSGSGTNPQYVAPGVTFNPSFTDVVGKQHVHNAQCKCFEGKK